LNHFKELIDSLPRSAIFSSWPFFGRPPKNFRSRVSNAEAKSEIFAVIEKDNGTVRSGLI
jgi:hypothetical protein